MNNDELKNTYEDFIQNPSQLSSFLITLAEHKHHRYETLYTCNHFIDRVKFHLKYSQHYTHIWNFIQTYKIPSLKESSDPIKKTDLLITEMSHMFDHIIHNNFFLTYAFLTHQAKKNPIITQEDKKLLCLKNFLNGEISRQEFNTAFGHYGLNPYELSEKRFYEYSDEDLSTLAAFTKNFKLCKTMTINDAVKSKRKNLFAIYAALREELKYLSLKIIAELRTTFLEIAHNNTINNIFDLSYDDIKRKIHSRA